MVINPVQKEVLSAREVAHLLDCHVRTVYRKTRKGVLKAYDFDGKKIYKYSDIAKDIFGENTAIRPEEKKVRA